jgi:hypothetical protein
MLFFRPHFHIICCLCVLLGCGTSAFAADVPCRFKADMESTEIQVVTNGKTIWSGSIDKLQTRTIPVPEGSFTVISKIYNQNLKTKGDVRTNAHTRQCLGDAVLVVPLFGE